MLSTILDFALKAHAQQKRKGTKIPYIVHPIETAVILAQNNATDEEIYAGILHDILEDTDKNAGDISEVLTNAGLNTEAILQILIGVTEPSKLLAKQTGQDEAPWIDRKEHTINFLEQLSNDELGRQIKLVTCADKLSNIRAMVNDYDQYEKQGIDGIVLFKKFNKLSTCGFQRWYYESLVKALQDLEHLPMYREFNSLVLNLFTRTMVLNMIASEHANNIIEK